VCWTECTVALGIGAESVHCRRVSETGYRGHDASLPYAAHPNQQVYENGIGMETAEQIRQDLLQVWAHLRLAA
jgi:hypothetical protein